MPLHAFEGVSRLRGSGQRRDHGEMRLVFVAQFGDEADVRRRFKHVWQMLDLLPRRLVEDSALCWGGRVTFFVTAEVSQVAAGGDDYGIEQTRFHQTPRRQLLQPDSEREHGHK